jgi:hypothetical protein
MNSKNNKYNANDTNDKPHYNIDNGIYKVKYNGKSFYVQLDDEKIYVYSYIENIDILKSFVNSIYKKYCTAERNVIYFTSDGDRWSFPIFRKPRNIDYLLKQKYINEVFKDSNNFFESRIKYENEGLPFRRGYLLYGIPGSGKSSSIEVIAIKHNMSVYMVNLNSKNMTDTILINLVCHVPPRSIIVFEEIDKQLETLQKNRNNQVSFGGILSAIDGPQRLNDGCIVIMTTNNNNFLGESERKSLIRPGRIDKVIEFKK